MAGSWSFGRARDLFAQQFEPEGAGYLYRKSNKDAPIAVSAKERDRYVAAYRAFFSYGIVGVTAAMLAFAFAAAFYGTAISESAFVAGTAMIGLLFVVAHRWAWEAPMRELRGRGFAGPAPSREEALQRTFSRITWPQLGFGLVFAAYLALRHGPADDWNFGRDWPWLGTAAAVAVLVLVQAFRKWRIEQSARLKR